MTGAVLLGVSLSLALGCAALAWSHVLRVLGATRGDLVTLAAALKRMPPADRARGLLDGTTPGSWEYELAAEVLAAPHDDARVAVVNLALSDVEHTLRRGAGWPPASLRLALTGAALLAVCAYVGDPAQPRWALAILGVGALAAVTCVEAGRAGERNVQRQRRAIDALVAVTMALAEGRTLPDPRPPSPHRARRHRGSS